jgi:hypothetical protein
MMWEVSKFWILRLKLSSDQMLSAKKEMKLNIVDLTL